MRSLEVRELRLVAGGNGSGGTSNSGSAARQAAVEQCQGLPDSTKVTFEISIEANVSGKVVGLGGEATTTQTVTIETTCGDLRAASGGGG
ncbi:hypothetical protein [Pseudoxanthomonas suwonensis]|jgi:hypothetical protein|uniref:hypothetical protein n=1 Tax=Pseudoxanthomonas suwonensis TaxID=314722 RepID=UPI0012DD4A0A|nr:hypothetical protein [Pseudoxanthomonas suwonensis]